MHIVRSTERVRWSKRIGRTDRGWWVGKNGVTATRRCRPRREAHMYSREEEKGLG
jgi:hypothetical protein